MIGDVKDFLEFSECNVDWQHRREMQAIAHRNDLDEFSPEYRSHLEQNADHRFKTSLPLRIRYGALLAFTTSVEWVVGYLNQSSVLHVPNDRDGANLTVKILRQFATRAAVESGGVIEDYEAISQIRNCIAHSAGIVATYRFKDDLPAAVSRIAGITLGNWHFVGEHICIERGALEPYIDRTAALIVTLHSAMREQGHLI